jgi:group II intron reverse transcriptase/maturase
MPVKANHPIGKVRQLQRKLYLSAKRSKSRRFHALYERIHDWDVLQEAWARVRSNRGAAGIDGETLKVIEAKGVESFLKGIEHHLQEGRYHPGPVRRVEIPKPDGRKRPLGIPTVRDRVVQMAAKIVLEPVFEADFRACSYGYRPKRSAVGAMERIRELANKGCNFVLDGDIRNYFGSIGHGKLLEAVRRRVSDRRVVKLIDKWLKAGVMTEGRLEPSWVGTPQGGVISPLLANVYLNGVDEAWERENSTFGELVRYCDDFVVLSRTRRAAEEARRRLAVMLAGLGLELHPEKTRVVELAWGKEGFDFLGWHVTKRASARFRGRYYLNRWPSRRSMSRLYARFRAMAHRNRRVRNVRELVPRLNAVLRGWAEYFRTGNSRGKFQQAQKVLWERLALFEAKRRYQRGPYWDLGRWNYDWFKGLGLFDLTRPGLIRYPGLAASHA